jgi:hypothetical protein
MYIKLPSRKIIRPQPVRFRNATAPWALMLRFFEKNEQRSHPF